MLENSPLTNLQTRDIESLVHPYTPIHQLKSTGTVVMGRGKGVYVYDTQGRGYIEGMSGLWCAGLGFGDDRGGHRADARPALLSHLRRQE
jgi:4-aminobutyrate--pyruvate transaminase